MRTICGLILSLAPAFDALAAEGGDEPRPLPVAHAHNDYLHKRPLLDALSHGFCSAEADIFLVEGRLLVAHERSSLDKARTLKALYLDPLRQRTRKNSGRVHKGGPVFTLLIDIKDNEVEGPDLIAGRIETAEKVLGPGRVKYVHPDCGFWMLKRMVADRKMEALVKGRDRFLGN